MTAYELNPTDRFTMTDALELVGKAAEITEWDDEDRQNKMTYSVTRVIGVIDRPALPVMVVETSGAVITDSKDGRQLSTRPAEPDFCIGFDWICEVTGVRDPYRPGDRIAFEETGDQSTRLRPGDEGTVTRYDPADARLDVRWDSGSTLSVLLNDGDRVRLIAT